VEAARVSFLHRMVRNEEQNKQDNLGREMSFEIRNAALRSLSREYTRNERILRRQHLKIDLGVLRCALVTEEGCEFPLYGIPADKVDEVLEAFFWLREFHKVVKTTT